jgi:hypothetical protein
MSLNLVGLAVLDPPYNFLPQQKQFSFAALVRLDGVRPCKGRLYSKINVPKPSGSGFTAAGEFHD